MLEDCQLWPEHKNKQYKHFISAWSEKGDTFYGRFFLKFLPKFRCLRLCKSYTPDGISPINLLSSDLNNKNKNGEIVSSKL